MAEEHKLIAVEEPDYHGIYEIHFTGDQVVIVKLLRATFDSYGHPIYLYAEDGTVYNFGNVLSVKRKEDIDG